MPVTDDGTRVWRDMEEFDTSERAHPNWPDRFFARLVDTYPAETGNPGGRVGDAQCFLLDSRGLLDARVGCDAGRGRRPARGRVLLGFMTHRFPLSPPIEPMLAKLATELPVGDGFLFEPKWDGFRAIVFRGGNDVFIQSRDLRPLDRYFPELHDALLAGLPEGCVVDGEIVIATPHGLDFDALQMRLHPAASRVAKLARETPAAFVAFDALAIDGQDLRGIAQTERRVRLERLLANTKPPIHLTPMTRDRAQASEWLARFEGAGLDGVIAKPADGTYQPGKRAMIKVKHARTADCVVAGFRWHKAGKDELIGSLLLGLYDDKRRLHHVGVTSSFTMADAQAARGGAGAVA